MWLTYPQASTDVFDFSLFLYFLILNFIIVLTVCNKIKIKTLKKEIMIVAIT